MDEYEPEYEGHDQYSYDDQPDVDEAESGSQEEEYDAWMEKRLLASKPGNNKGHALGKVCHFCFLFSLIAEYP
jgi:hypothetical protein